MPQAAPVTKKPILTRELGIFLGAMVLANLGGSLFYPFFGLYLSALGTPIETIGLFFTMMALFPLLFQIFGGWASDRIGRLRSIAIGSVAGAVSWLGMLLAPGLPHPLAWFLVSNAVGSITVALVAPSYDAFIAEKADPGSRARVFAVVQSIFLVVGIAGPPIGGLIVQHLSFKVLTWTGALLYWSATVIRIGMAKDLGKAGPQVGAGEAKGENLTFGKSLKAVLALFLSGGLFTLILLVDGALDISGKLSGDLLPLYLKQVGGQTESTIGFLQGFSALVTALAMIPLGALADRRGEKWPLVLGCLISGLAPLVLWRGQTAFAFGGAFFLFGLGGAAFQPAMQALTARAVPERLRGLAYGFLGSSLGLFSFYAPALGAWLWKEAFPALPFLISGLMLLLAGLATGIFIGRVRGYSEEGPGIAEPDCLDGGQEARMPP